jgi:mono/diheme cytochrome c family protein
MSVALLLWILFSFALAHVAPESSPVARGAEYAQSRGCVACHGDVGNPSPDSSGSECSAINAVAAHPDYPVRCSDVMAFFEAVRLRRSFAERVEPHTGNLLGTGESLARKYHCFQCHGYMGQGGFRNAGALKGYVPGFFGSDFIGLTRNGDPDSVRAWIVNGVDSSLVDEPLTGTVAAFFLGRQAVKMPAFGSLETSEIDALVRYVIALSDHGPMTAESLRAYGEKAR